MSRPESVALAGFYPCPLPVVELLASLFEKAETVSSWPSYYLSLVDPCAGEGHAAALFLQLVSGDARRAVAYGCEMELARFEAARSSLGKVAKASHVLHADAFRVLARREGGASFLFLNPPYDPDRDYGRMEEKFLDRFAPLLAAGGWLLFVVPYSSLAASAETIAREFDVVDCYRFPVGEFEAYKQCVLVARRAVGRESSAEVREKVDRWSRDLDSFPVLRLVESPLYELPKFETGYQGGIASWEAKRFDVEAVLRKARPWASAATVGARLVDDKRVVPNLPLAELMLRRYPMATPPRPAHLAAGIAAGVFNGSRVDPPPGSPLPPLLVKGVFDREYRPIDEKKNRNGQVVGVVEVQQPKLVVTAFDLRARKYHVLKSSTESTSEERVEDFGVADLLSRYGEGLLGVMREHCPITYDPKRDEESVMLYSPERPLFVAQAHAARALVKLLGGQCATNRRGKAAILAGEIGSGKSSVSLVAARTCGARRVLVVCPPHLLDSWRNEVRSVYSDARYVVLESILDVDVLASTLDDRFTVAVLSREAAKLGHSWDDSGESCPRCGSSFSAEMLLEPGLASKKRARCEAKAIRPRDSVARLALALATTLSYYEPDAPTARRLLGSRFAQKRMDAASARNIPLEYAGVSAGTRTTLARLLAVLAKAYLKQGADRESIGRALVYAAFALGDDEKTFEAIEALRKESIGRHLAKLLSVNPKARERRNAIAAAETAESQWGVWHGAIEAFARVDEEGDRVAEVEMVWRDGEKILGGAKHGSVDALRFATSSAASAGTWTESEECGEFLFQAVPQPRRYPLARYVQRRAKRLFDFLVHDEAHEGHEKSATEHAVHRIQSIGMPTIAMTGSLMNGYATSLFPNMWAASPAFREEFDRDQSGDFVERYGYRKRVVEERDANTKELVEYGRHSDRVTKTERVTGEAPGVLPLFLLRHLLPVAVTLQKADLAIDLPPCTTHLEEVEPDADVKAAYERLKRRLVEQVKKDKWDEQKSGKLFGQLSELPSYLDRATRDVGNEEGGDYAIRYPESLDGELLIREPGKSQDRLLPKERWLLKKLKEEIEEGRNAMVFAWHLELLPRLVHLVQHALGTKPAVLHASKVAPKKRQEWIEREVIAKRARVLVTNPVAIQTGLNNLVYFSSEYWMENPACNPIVYRQAGGRIDRVGQKEPTRIYFATYANTIQREARDLLLRKVNVSLSTDGLDPDSALASVGIGESDFLAGMSLGRHLWKMMTEEE